MQRLFGLLFYLQKDAIPDLRFWYCQQVGHLEDPPYHWKYEGSWPRCRRCKLACIPGESIPSDFWQNPIKYDKGFRLKGLFE